MNADDTPMKGSRCLDADGIVDVCGALRSDPVETLSHLLECAECRRMIATVGAVHRAYALDTAQSEDHAEALAERVIGRISLPGQVTTTVRRPSALSRWGLAAANWTVAAVAGFWGVAIVSSGSVEIGLQGAAMAAAVTGFIPVVHGILVERRTASLGPRSITRRVA